MNTTHENAACTNASNDSNSKSPCGRTIVHSSDHEEIPPCDEKASSGVGGNDGGGAHLSDFEELGPADGDPEAGALSVLSRRPSAALSDPGPPPDGGWHAWMTCFGAHIVIANTWGFINSFGIFQTYYADFLEHLTPSTISWIGSLQVFLAFFLSAGAGRISDAGYFRLCFWTGAFLEVLGIVATSFCTRYWQLMLAQGLCVGMAAGLLCTTTMSIVATFFQRRRSLALGIVTCGNVSGGLVFPVMARQMIPSVGFAWTLRAVGILQAVLLVAAGLAIRTRVRPRVSGPLVDMRALLEPEYTLYAVGMVFNLAGAFVAIYYIASFGRNGLKAPLSYPDSLNLLIIFNSVGVIGRLSAAYFADHVGPLNIIYPGAFVGSLLCFAWMGVHTQAGVYIWTTFYCISAGILQALLPAGLSSLTTDVRKMGQRISLGFTFIGASVLFGPPAAGAMITAMNGSYIGAQAYCGSLLFIGGCLVALAKVVRMRKTGGRWSDKM